jgi:hypothetical protein
VARNALLWLDGAESEAEHDVVTMFEHTIDANRYVGFDPGAKGALR